MRQLLIVSTYFVLALAATWAQLPPSPFLGRWDFNVRTDSGMRANWMEVSDEGGKMRLWFQPTGGHVVEVNDFHTDGHKLSFIVAPASSNHPATTWELNASSDRLTGTQKRGDSSISLVGTHAPSLERTTLPTWGQPEQLFDGKDLNGWEPVGDTSQNHWVVQGGVMLNKAHGANLKTTREFTDFKLHFEVNCPEKANSGMYLRGRYELQLEYEPGDTEPIERAMGSIYGRIAPSAKLPRRPNTWETFDVTLVGRTVTVSRDGVNIIDHKQIDGITGGALDANEAQPGSFYIQGDHTGGLMFRNITVALPAS